MINILINKITEGFYFKKKTLKKRLLYSSYFFISDYKVKLKLLSFSLFYKNIIFERKLYSPFYGKKPSLSLLYFLNFLFFDYKKNVSILIDRKHFGSSYFEFPLLLKNSYIANIKFFPLIKDFNLFFYKPGIFFILNSFLILIIFDLFSFLYLLNIIKFLKFYGLTVLLEISSFFDFLSFLNFKYVKNILIGINSRNLFNFNISYKEFFFVSANSYIYESGILSLNHLFKIRNLGYKTCLIGSGLSNLDFYLS